MKTIFIRATIRILCTTYFILSAVAHSKAQGLASIQLTDFKAVSKNGDVGLSWKTSSEQDIRQFEIEFSQDGKYYRNLGFIAATNNINGDFYEFEHDLSYTDSAFYRLKIVDKQGRWQYTAPVLFQVNKTTAFFVYPSVISTDMMSIFLHDPFNSLEVVSMNGTVMLKQNLSGTTGRIDVPLSPMLSPGVYVVQLNNYRKTITQKIVIQ